MTSSYVLDYNVICRGIAMLSVSRGIMLHMKLLYCNTRFFYKKPGSRPSTKSVLSFGYILVLKVS